MSESQSRIDRRSFLATTALTGTAIGSLSMNSTSMAEDAAGSKSSIKAGDTILFQGDSITDAGRSRKTANEANNHEAMGRGYAHMTAAAILASHPESNLKIYNRGISGNKVHQLASRWDADCLDLKPNVLSILIGVNDIWHGLNGKYDGTVKTYEDDFRALLARTQKALPDTTIVICEPFVLKCGAVNDKWFPEFDKYRAAAKKLSKEFQTKFVPFQTMFDEAVKFAPPNVWAGDGVHPSANGAALMSNFWLKTVIG